MAKGFLKSFFFKFFKICSEFTARTAHSSVRREGRTHALKQKVGHTPWTMVDATVRTPTPLRSSPRRPQHSHQFAFPSIAGRAESGDGATEAAAIVGLSPTVLDRPRSRQARRPVRGGPVFTVAPGCEKNRILNSEHQSWTPT